MNGTTDLKERLVIDRFYKHRTTCVHITNSNLCGREREKAVKHSEAIDGTVPLAMMLTELNKDRSHHIGLTRFLEGFLEEKIVCELCAGSRVCVRQ